VVNNTAISLFGQVVTWTSTFLLTIAYGRFLGDFKFGELYLATSLVMLIGIPIERGFNQQITREVAQEPEKAFRYLSNTILIKGGLWLVLYGLTLLVCWALGYSMEERVLVAICGFTLLSTAITTTFASLFYSFERVIFSVTGSILEKGLSALLGFLLLSYGAGVQVMAFVLLGGSLASTIWLAVWFFRYVRIDFATDLPLIRQLIRTSVPFLIYGVLGIIYYRIDTVLLSLMTNAAVVGWYGAGYRLFDTLVFLPNIVIMVVMYPVFSKFSATSEAHLKLAIEKSTNFLLFCGIPIVGGLIIAAPNIISFLYQRSEFSHTIPVLQALAPGLIFLYINSVFCTVLISTKLEKKMTIMAAIALVFNLGLNLILIPRYQDVGAAAVTSFTELLLFFIAMTFVPRYLLPFGSLRVGVKATIACAVMILVLLPLRTFNIFVLLPIAMFVYFGTATLLGTIPREDIQALFSAIRHKVESASLEPIAEQQEVEGGVLIEDATPYTAASRPQVNGELLDEKLIRETHLVMRIVNLSRSALEKAQIKKRQPLNALYVRVPSQTEEEALLRLKGQVLKELNIKHLELMSDDSDALSYILKPRVQAIGHKYGPLSQAILTSFRALDAQGTHEAAKLLKELGLLIFTIAGEQIKLTSDEIEVVAAARPGFVTAEEDGYLVALETAITSQPHKNGYT